VAAGEFFLGEDDSRAHIIIIIIFWGGGVCVCGGGPLVESLGSRVQSKF